MNHPNATPRPAGPHRAGRRPCLGRLSLPLLVLGAVLIAAAVAAWWFYARVQPPVPAPMPTPAATGKVEPQAPAPPAEPASVAAALPEPVASQALAAPDIDSELTAWLGRQAVAQFLQLDDLPRRITATTDNLARSQAASRLWPVQRTPGRFAVVERDGHLFIDPANASRYEPFVRWVDGLDPARAADLYVRLLPLLQRSYEDLGFPRQRFHARAMAVIDHLLAAPQPSGPVALTLTEVHGDIPSTRPWVRYEYADPAMEQASAGHKILMRLGPGQAQRLKTWLAAFRAQVQQRAGEAPR